ncbi:MAG: hypothetical protein ABSH20_23430, partial [Tepidisphaeraceae bacterium]
MRMSNDSIQNDAFAAGSLSAGWDLSREVFGQIAVQARNAGFCMMVFSPDGRLIYHDAGVAPFFDRYVVPVTQYADDAGRRLREAVSNVTMHCPVQAW